MKARNLPLLRELHGGPLELVTALLAGIIQGETHQLILPDYWQRRNRVYNIATRFPSASTSTMAVTKTKNCQGDYCVRNIGARLLCQLGKLPKISPTLLLNQVLED